MNRNPKTAPLALAALGAIILGAGLANAQVPPPPIAANGPVGAPAVSVPIPPPPFMTPDGMTGMAGSSPVMANPPSGQATEGAGAQPAGMAEPATDAQPAAADGTAPGNDGSTGWTGGTGGSNIGTNPQGAVATSKTWQPPTARGLDLMGVADPVAKP
ncbi:hypothetical protein ACEYYB_04925 [Paracoccus sp. p4-l81]|uniref:hypothetical protein n=1 Tax=unclassified Paracoccus (in: a-proteobacteria) TaxID=2688777 RepID=UPI0035B97531